MAISVTHSFVSAIPDGGDPTIVQPSNWNDTHVVTGLATVATTGAVSDLSGLGTGIAAALAINTGSSGAPALFNGALGTPSSGTLTNCTSLPISTGVSGLGTGIATALAVNTGASGAPALINGALGTPSSGTLTNCTGLPAAGVTGTALVASAIGTTVQAYDADLTTWAGITPGANVGTFLATPSSANLRAALTDETGSGAAVFADTPTLIAPILGTPTSGTLTNCSGLPAAGYATMVGDSGAGGTKGAVPAPAAGDATKFLRGDATWVAGTAAPVTYTISNKTTAYTVVAADLGTIINCTSGTFSVTLTAAATLGAGFNCWVWNSSTVVTNAITIDPAGAETIDGRALLTLYPGEGVQIVCDGANWKAGDNKRPQFYCENTSGAFTAPVASGVGSVVVGPRSTASGTRAFAAGYFCTASSTGSTAIGQNSSNEGAQAVTGAGAMALGGSYASGTDSFAAAIANNTSTYGATGANAVAIGAGLAKASGARALAMMNNAVASGDDSIAVGHSSTASAKNSVALGFGAIAAIAGKYAYAGGALSGAGSSQNASLNLIKATTDATASVLTSDAGAAAATNQVILPNNSAYAFDGLVIARRQAAGGTESASWKVEGHIRRDANAASTTLVASTVTAISNVPGWTLVLSADTTNGGLAVTFTGAAATNIRTVANIRTVEVTYA